MVSFNNATNDEISEEIMKYFDSEYYDMIDFDTVIKRAEIIEDRHIVKFELHFIDLFLDTRDLSFVDVHPLN